MPVTRNVAWDSRLESFNGRDTTHYVSTAAAIATTCPVCRHPLQPNEPLSLSVDITESTAPDGTEYVTFRDYVCHRHCSAPGLTVHTAPWRPADLTPLAARLVLTQTAGAGNPGIVVPALAYTLVPVVSFREPGGELTSALVSMLLSHGFQLALSPDYTAILEQAADVAASCRLTATRTGFITLDIGGETIYSEQLDPMKPDDAQWLEQAAAQGSVLVIAGDNLVITDRVLDVDAAVVLAPWSSGRSPSAHDRSPPASSFSGPGGHDKSNYRVRAIKAEAAADQLHARGQLLLGAVLEEFVDGPQRGERTGIYRVGWDVQVHGQFAYRDLAIMQRHQYLTLFPVQPRQRFLDQVTFQGAFDLPGRFRTGPVGFRGIGWTFRFPLDHGTQSAPAF
ncbi:hypothetical protein QFZ23_002100 [Arthrobacter globiformis]|uniref:hypothetical protein n=1 Tax=Arthrobacter globiformis TaxID=1665 RepID=UPI0027837301|nr:hypothetical protein [Arthrobacter globiformis]MDQ1058199.1 hypothetical protein [Arthrobacter globiformis]